MKTEKFSMRNKSEFFDRADAMHDCFFTAALEDRTLVLVYDRLEQYCGPAPDSPWFAGFHQLTVRYHGIDYLDLRLKFKRKEMDFDNTVAPLENRELIMNKYSVDSFGALTLYFGDTVGKKRWGGTIEMMPDEIEYIWT